MDNVANPFFLNSYHSPEYFCDRQAETARLNAHIKNGVNSTLFSIRRMGKTGLIHHVFHGHRNSRTVRCIYADIYATRNLKEFTNLLSTAIFKAFPEKNRIGKNLLTLFKSLRPVISFDALTGTPEVNFDFGKTKEYEQSLTSLFSFLDSQGVTVVVAMDEFQQIATYPEQNAEAFLRTAIQPLKNVRFIFCGSNKHLLAQIFTDSKRPFFSSTQILHLDQIEEQVYSDFISRIFNNGGKKIDAAAVEFILNFTKLHTYYVQAVCNRVYAESKKHILPEDVKQICSLILKEYESVFFQYRNLLTPIQWSLLKAIAKEDKLYQPSAKRFLQAYNVGTSANVQRALEALLTKEMVYKQQEEQGAYYRVYDCFLARWLER